MKLILLLSFFSSMFLQGQQEETTRLFTRGVMVAPFDLRTQKADVDNREIAQRDWKFKIDAKVSQIDASSGPKLDGYVITFQEWNGGAKNKKQQKNEKFVFNKVTVKADGKTKQETEQKYYFITDMVFDEYTTEYLGDAPKFSFISGAITVPFKLRPGSEQNPNTGERERPFDFDNDFNVGLSFGVRLRLSRKHDIFVNLMGGISIASIDVNAADTNGFVTEQTNAASFSPSIGAIFQFNNIQLGLINGWDHLSRDLGDSWVYQGLPWYGIGLGYNIFASGVRDTGNRTP